MTRTRWIIFALICIITLGGLVLLSRKDRVDVAGLDPAKAISETETAIGDQVYGNKAAKVVWIEYGDFQCPGCGGAHPQVQIIKELYKDKVAFMFRNFPLTNIHPNALAAATAAEAAGLQGKFWEMHDKLYTDQTSWSNSKANERTDVFAGYARSIGLDVDRFKNDLSEAKISTKISRDRAFAQKLNVTATPTFYVGSERVADDVANDLIQGKANKMMDRLDAALKAAGVEPPKRS